MGSIASLDQRKQGSCIGRGAEPGLRGIGFEHDGPKAAVKIETARESGDPQYDGSELQGNGHGRNAGGAAIGHSIGRFGFAARTRSAAKVVRIAPAASGSVSYR